MVSLDLFLFHEFGLTSLTNVHYISIAYGDENSTQQVSEELKSEVEDIAASIVSGEINVETARQ